MSEGGVSRRTVLLGAAGVTGMVGVIGSMGYVALQQGEASGPTRVTPSSEAVRRREQARRAQATGRTVRAGLTAEPTDVDLGGRVVRTWAYNGQTPGPIIRCGAGDQLQVDVGNRLPDPTTVHWHGLQLRNDMDGVPNLTQAAIPPGEGMRYSFIVSDSGTYWLHPHVNVQRERGLFAPLIIDDPREPGDYDVEFVVVLDDWIDSVAASPDQVLANLRGRKAMAQYKVPVEAGKIPEVAESWQYHVPSKLTNPPSGQEPVSAASRMASSVAYPLYLLNGRLPTSPHSFRAKPGERARLRLINAGGATVFRVALGGHRLRVTHTDGFPVEPVTVDTLQLASGERYDVDVTLGDGAFPLVGVAEGKGAEALGVVRTASGPTPSSGAVPDEMAGRLLALEDLRATSAVRVQERAPDVSHTLYLTGDMNTFGWRINAEKYDAARPFNGITPQRVRKGQRVQLVMVNQTPTYHPMHLHGHTFTVRSVGDIGQGTQKRLPAGTRKDTLMVGPGERISVDFTADNPGQWLVHCHNAYHLATGMATIVSYVADS